MASHTPSQRYLSTRDGSHDANVQQLSFEEVVLRGLAPDGGLYLPSEIPSLPFNWEDEWRNLSFQDLALRIFSLYISPAEIPPPALKEIVDRSYSTFRVPEVAPTVPLDQDRRMHLLELFHGPTFAFKDVALQFLGNVFEFFLARKNEGKTGKEREHLTIAAATSGDTGSAAIYGLRSKADISLFILYPTGKISPIQEAQMTTVKDPNVHCLSVDGTFDDCQDFVKALFADPKTNSALKIGAVNSINWARILAQITYYFFSYLSVQKSSVIKPPDDQIRFVVPTGNFGDILAGYYAKRMGLVVEKLVISCNPNDILHRFWQTGSYEKHPVHGAAANGGFAEDGVKAHTSGVKESYSPAMDILVSSNFERLLWYLAYDTYPSSTNNTQEKRKLAGAQVKEWQTALKTTGGFSVDQNVLEAARKDFASERVSDAETLVTIRDFYRSQKYTLDPHSAVGVTAALRSSKATPSTTHHISLATAHPAKFSSAVELALKEEKDFRFEDIQPKEFVGLDRLPKRITHIKKRDGVDGIRELMIDRVRKEGEGEVNGT